MRRLKILFLVLLFTTFYVEAQHKLSGVILDEPGKSLLGDGIRIIDQEKNATITYIDDTLSLFTGQSRLKAKSRLLKPDAL